MKFRSLILASSLLAATTGPAFAQSSPSPNNQSGPGVSPSVQAPTDQGAGGNVTGNTKAMPERGTMGAGGGAGMSGTTGSGSMGASGSMSSHTSGQRPAQSDQNKMK